MSDKGKSISTSHHFSVLEKNLKEKDDIIKNLKQELYHLRSIIAVMPGNVFWKDRQHVYQGCNNNVIKIFKLNSEQDFIGKKLEEVSPPNTIKQDVIEQITLSDEELMRTGTPKIIEESAFNEKFEPAIYLTQKVPLRDKDGNVNGLLGISLDITQQKINEAALQKAKEDAELANKAKSQFIMNMSHDLRTPFSGILGFARLLAEKEKDSEKKVMLSYVIESSEKLLALLNDILEFSKAENSSNSAHPIPFNIWELNQQVAGLMLAEIERKKLQLVFEIDPKIPTLLVGEKLKLHRILLNLVNNAVKFTHKGHIAIKIKILERKPEQIILHFAIEDSGIGIPANNLETIFESFNRLTSSYQSQYHGTGLGLSIVKQFVKQLGGEIKVESEIEKGSIFSFDLPFSIPVELLPENKQEKELDALKLEKITPQLQRIMLVEDDLIAQKLATIMLTEQFNCPVDIAANGEQALKLAYKNNYNLILMDIGLPDIDGFTIAQQIRKLPTSNEKTIIVGLSAHVDDNDRKAANNNHMNDIYNKPLSKEILYQLILKNYLGWVDRVFS